MHACFTDIKNAEDISYFGNKEVFCDMIVLKKPPVVTSDFVNSLKRSLKLRFPFEW
jgi:hypothetical protein